ncbi:MAG: SDR family oxidoreductase [Spongiibacteraceae bacterium]|nr:SDR family oxidoreductase [Spongiibacteraceae bacterium]
MSKVIVITGAGIGLGRALAKRFATEGHQVVLLGRTLSKVQSVSDDIGKQALAIACDVGLPDSVTTAFNTIAEHHSQIDVLINNAAIFEPFLLADAKDEQIINTINTNLIGPMLCVRAALPMMQSGSHIFTISGESVDMDFPHLSVYQASKAGIERLSKSLYSELKPQGIRVTNIRAGAMFEDGKTWDVDPEAQIAFAKAAFERGIKLRERPLSQFTSASEVFSALINLPSDIHAETISLHAREAE